MNTLRQNLLLLEHRRVNEENAWNKTRYAAFSNYNSTVGMNGKQVFQMKKPSDLFELDSDTLHKKEYKRDTKRAQEAFNRHKNLTNGSSR